MAESEFQGEATDDRQWRITRAAQRIVRWVKWILRWGGLATLFVVIVALWLWTAVALGVYGPWPVWLRVPAVVLWVSLPVAGRFWVPRLVPIREFSRIVLAAVIIAGYIATRLLWNVWTATNESDWIADQDRMAHTRIEGTTVTIENVRNQIPGQSYPTDDYWETRVYDITELRTVDLVICPFSWDRRGMAHTFLTFGFENGEHVAVSVEARYHEGDNFGIVKGLFRGFGLIYVIADERDVIGVRTNVRNDPLYLYPLRVQPALAQAIFVMMMTRTDRVDHSPEFYNLFTNSCASNMVRHISQAYQGSPHFDVRLYVPGYIDDYAAGLGLLDISGPLEEVREQYLVNDRDLTMTDSISWSRQLRGE